jgi:hypothetical protein
MGPLDEDSKAAVKYKEYIAVRMCGGSPNGADGGGKGAQKSVFKRR